MNSGNTRKYLLYALGEIFLVVVGILIALQINNLNESRKSKKEFKQSLVALLAEIKQDTVNMQNYVQSLDIQEKASALLIPALERKKITSEDSLEFALAFMSLSSAVNTDLNTEIWDEIRTSGLHKVFASEKLIESIQFYYHIYKRYANNWKNGYRNRIEMRELKYNFLSQSDLDLIRSESPKTPSKEAFNAIFDEPQVLTLAKSIKYTSGLFSGYFSRNISIAEELINLLEKEIESL